MAAGNETYDVFLSYSWKIQDKVKRLYDFLTNKHKFKVWMDIKEFQGGEVVDATIADTIRNSKVFVCCINSDYVKSIYCNNELSYACNNNINLLALMFEDLTSDELGGVGLQLARLIYIPLFNTNVTKHWTGEQANQIVKSINSFLKKGKKNDKKNEKEKSSSEDSDSSSEDETSSAITYYNIVPKK